MKMENGLLFVTLLTRRFDSILVRLSEQGLSEIHLPIFPFSETDAITTDDPAASQFKIVVGGNFKLERQDFGIGGDGPVVAAPG